MDEIDVMFCLCTHNSYLIYCWYESDRVPKGRISARTVSASAVTSNAQPYLRDTLRVLAWISSVPLASALAIPAIGAMTHAPFGNGGTGQRGTLGRGSLRFDPFEMRGVSWPEEPASRDTLYAFLVMPGRVVPPRARIVREVRDGAGEVRVVLLTLVD